MDKLLLTITESAKDAINTIDQLTALHDKDKVLLRDGVTKRQIDTLERLFAYLEASPIIDIMKTAQALNVSYNAVARAVSVLEEKGILKQSQRHGRTRIYAYTEYPDILGKDV